MKRVVDGKAYNTETAERIAVAKEPYEKAEREWVSEVVLYRTPKGAWFLVETEWPEKDNSTKWADQTRVTFTVLDGHSSGCQSPLDAALQWVQRTQCELIKPDYFPAIEEA